MHTSICTSSSNSILRDRDSDLHRHDHRVDGRLEIRKLAYRRADRFRYSIKPQLDLGDDAERAFRTDEEPGEIVAGARLAGTAAGPDDAAVRRDHGQAKDVFAHRPVAHGIGTRRSRRGHAADGRVGARVDGEEQARALELRVHLFASNAGLHAAVEVLRVDFQHAVHPRQVDADTAVQRRHVAFERRSDAERDHGNARGVTQPDDRRHFLVGVREHDDVGQRRVRHALAVAVLLAHRVAGHRAFREIFREFLDDGRHIVRGRPCAQFGGSVHAGSRFNSVGCRDAEPARRARASCRIRRSARASGPPCRD